jgi:hypothetical protein
MKQRIVLFILGIILVGSLCFTCQENYQDSKTAYASNQMASSMGTILTPSPSSAGGSITQFSRYDPNNTNVEYHSTNFQNDNDATANFTSSTAVKDPVSGDLIYLPNQTTQGYATYNQPDSFPFGPFSFVPNYEDSVYLSRSADIQIQTPVFNTVAHGAGFCTTSANDPGTLEATCNHLDTNICASTNCCVLLGGAKCVAGGQQGVTMKSNYNDPGLLNKDFYYYQGKCYGNCYSVN